MNHSIKITISVITIVVLIIALASVFDQHKETKRLSRTLTQTVQQLKQVETRSGQLAAENDVMQLKLKELNILYPDLVNEIRNLKIDPNRAGQIAATGYRAEKKLIVPLLDSLVSDSAQVKVFNYHDKWYDIRGLASDTIQHLQFRYQDTLVQVVYLGKRYRPWLWIFSPRRLKQRVMLKNPDARIGYAEVIQIEKRKP